MADDTDDHWRNDLPPSNGDAAEDAANIAYLLQGTESDRDTDTERDDDCFATYSLHRQRLYGY